MYKIDIKEIPTPTELEVLQAVSRMTHWFMFFYDGNFYWHKYASGEYRAAHPYEYADKRFDKVYVRFGHLPPDNVSKNHRDNFYEKGVSCYKALLDPMTTRAIPMLPSIDVCVRSTFVSFSYGAATLEERPGEGLEYKRHCYLIRGVENGVGSDGEPVLTEPELSVPVKIVFKMLPDDTVFGDWSFAAHPPRIFISPAGLDA